MASQLPHKAHRVSMDSWSFCNYRFESGMDSSCKRLWLFAVPDWLRKDLGSPPPPAPAHKHILPCPLLSSQEETSQEICKSPLALPLILPLKCSSWSFSELLLHARHFPTIHFFQASQCYKVDVITPFYRWSHWEPVASQLKVESRLQNRSGTKALSPLGC